MTAEEMAPKITALEEYIKHLRAELASREQELKDLRFRAFYKDWDERAKERTTHTTSCTIWRDDGQGNAPEFKDHCGPCNCGALENFERKRAEKAEQEVAELKAKVQHWRKVASEVSETSFEHFKRADRLEKALQEIIGQECLPSHMMSHQKGGTDFCLPDCPACEKKREDEGKEP